VEVYIKKRWFNGCFTPGSRAVGERPKVRCDVGNSLGAGNFDKKQLKYWELLGSITTLASMSKRFTASTHGAQHLPPRYDRKGLASQSYSLLAHYNLHSKILLDLGAVSNEPEAASGGQAEAPSSSACLSGTSGLDKLLAA
jgi:hypothetical protein